MKNLYYKFLNSFTYTRTMLLCVLVLLVMLMYDNNDIQVIWWSFIELSFNYFFPKPSNFTLQFFEFCKNFDNSYNITKHFKNILEYIVFFLRFIVRCIVFVLECYKDACDDAYIISEREILESIEIVEITFLGKLFLIAKELIYIFLVVFKSHLIDLYKAEDWVNFIWSIVSILLLLGHAFLVLLQAIFPLYIVILFTLVIPCATCVAVSFKIFSIFLSFLIAALKFLL